MNATNSTIGAIQWLSSNDEIATVDQNGVVTAISAGDVTISVKYTVQFPANEGSVPQIVECTNSLTFTCTEQPPEIGDVTSILQIIIEIFMMLVKFVISLFSSNVPA